MAYLCKEDENPQRVDEADHDRTRHEPHQTHHSEEPKKDLHDSRQKYGRQDVFGAVELH